MDDWKIERSKKRCHTCPEEFEIGDSYISCILEGDAGFERIDICAECWQNSAPEKLYAHWKTEVPEPKKPKMIVDDAVLFDFFLGLEGVEDQTKIEFRYMLALMLMRKRFLSFEDMRVEDGVTLMSVTLRGGGQQDVIDPGISEEKIAKLQKELNAVFTVDIVEKPKAVQLALPAGLYVDAKAEDVLDLAAVAGLSYAALDGATVPLSADIARCETIRDYAKEKGIQLSLFQSSFRILESKNWRKAFDPWLTHARAIGSKLIAVRCGFDATQSIDSQLPELGKRLTNLIKRCLRYKLRLVLESDELSTAQLQALQQSQEEGFLLNTLEYVVTANADELAQKVTQPAASGGFARVPLMGVDGEALGAWVRAIAAGNFSGVVLPVNRGVAPSSEELKALLSSLKVKIEEAQG